MSDTAVSTRSPFILSAPVRILVEATVVGAAWMSVYPLRHRASGDVTWDAHLALGLLPFVCWIVLAWAGVRGWWRFGASLAGVAMARWAPIAVTAFSPALPTLIDPQFSIAGAPALVIVFMELLPALILLGRALPGERMGQGPVVSRRETAALGLMLAMGVSAAFSVMCNQWSEATPGLQRPLLPVFVRDGFRWCAVVCIALFIAICGGRLNEAPRRASVWLRGLSDRTIVAACCLLSVLWSGLFAALVLNRMPHVQDEIAMIFQAKVFATGRLYVPVPEMAAFFDQEFLLQDDGRWYSKYQLGPSLWYLPGVLIRCPWMVSPVFGGLAVIALFFLAREVFGSRVARGVAIVAAFSPWWLLTYGSMMAHPGCLFVLMLFSLFFVRAARVRGRWGSAALAGLFLGLGANWRPFTALLFSAGVIVVALAAGWWRNLRFGPAVAFFVALAALIGVMFAYNQALTGDARVAPFEKWSPYDRIGFGEDRGQYLEGDMGFSPQDAVATLRMRVQLLGEAMMGWPSATLALLVLPLAAVRYRRRAAALLVFPLLMAGGYFFYHYGGWELYGPRYWSEALPAYLILTLVGLLVVRRGFRAALRGVGVRGGPGLSRAVMGWMLVLLAAGALYTEVPEILQYHDDDLWPATTRPHRAVREMGIHNAVVFMDSPHYRGGVGIDWYGAGFYTMSPDLKDDVLYARNLGDEQNRALMAHYPERSFYLLEQPSLEMVKLMPYDGTGAGAGHHPMNEAQLKKHRKMWGRNK